MTDIVKWLRGMGEYTRKQTTNGYRYDEAADEIERLRADAAENTRLLQATLERLQVYEEEWMVSTSRTDQ